MTTTIIENTNRNLLRDELLNYYNLLIINKIDPALSADNDYFFKEMKDIATAAKKNPSGSTTTISNVASASAIANNTPTQINFLNYFIASCLNWTVSSILSDYDNFPTLAIRKSVLRSEQNDFAVYNDIMRHLNVLNVIIDILEAYKVFIDNNLATFNSDIQAINTIRLVSEFTRFDDSNVSKNFGYKHSTTGNSVLMLCVKSFPKNLTASQQNDIFTLYDITNYRTVITAKSDFEGGTDGQYAANGDKYYRQEISITSNGKVSHNGVDMNNIIKINKDSTFTAEVVAGGGLSNVQRRDKAIIQNFLYFLIRMNKDSVRTQVYALYYYYKIVRLYALLVCASVPVALYDFTADNGDVNYIKIHPLTSAAPNAFTDATLSILQTDDAANYMGLINTYSGSSPTATTVTNQYKALIKNLYQEIRKYASAQLTTMQNELNSLTQMRQFSFVNIPYSFIVWKDTIGDADRTSSINYKNTQNTTQIKIDYDSSSIKTPIDAITAAQKIYIKTNYVLLYKARTFTINEIDTTNKIITINANFDDTTTSSSHPLGHNYSSFAKSLTIGNVQIIPIGLSELKTQYADSKNKLSSISDDISKNAVKINNQRNLFNYQKSKYDLLNAQITTYAVIISIILMILVGLYIVNASKDTKKLVSVICGIVILLVIIVYYFVNISYLQESFGNKYDLIETFAVKNDADFLISSTTKAELLDTIQSDLLQFNTTVIATLQIAMGAIPLKETTDFYSQLNEIISIEKQDKQELSNILSHKKTLGYSNIDILKYENNNMKVYIFVLLTTAALFTLLYILSLYLPDDYNNLIVFVAVLCAIVIFSYYLIFTNQLVRTKSYHKYWGPSTMSDK